MRSLPRPRPASRCTSRSTPGCNGSVRIPTPPPHSPTRSPSVLQRSASPVCTATSPSPTIPTIRSRNANSTASTAPCSTSRNACRAGPARPHRQLRRRPGPPCDTTGHGPSRHRDVRHLAGTRRRSPVHRTPTGAPLCGGVGYVKMARAGSRISYGGSSSSSVIRTWRPSRSGTPTVCRDDCRRPAARC